MIKVMQHVKYQQHIQHVPNGAYHLRSLEQYGAFNSRDGFTQAQHKLYNRVIEY